MVVQTVFPIFCNFSKYIRLAQTDFHKKSYFIGNQEKMYVVTTPPSFKKFPEGNRRKFTFSFAFCAHVDVIKIEKY